jgi:hypothetical protein
MEIGWLGGDSAVLEDLETRARQIVRSSLDPAQCLRMMRAKAASILNSGARSRCKETVTGKGIPPIVAQGLPPSRSSKGGGESIHIPVEAPPPPRPPAKDKEEINEIEVIGSVRVDGELEMGRKFVQKESILEIFCCETCTAAHVIEGPQDIGFSPLTVKCNEDKHFAPFLVMLPENKEVAVQLGSLTHRMLEFF